MLREKVVGEMKKYLTNTLGVDIEDEKVEKILIELEKLANEPKD